MASAPWALRNVVVLLGLPALALAVVLGIRYGAPVNRAGKDDDEQAIDISAEEEPEGRIAVTFKSRDIVSTAGIGVEPVQTRAMASSISCNGSVAFNGNAYVKVPPKAAGILGAIHVDLGASVKKGDLLAVINSQVLGDLKAALIRATIHEEHSRAVIQRYKDVGQGVPLKDLIEQQHLLEEELTETRRIKDRLAELGLSRDQIDRIPETKDSSIQLPVFAPRGGTIVARQAVEGETVDTSVTLFAIADLTTMWVDLNIYESALEQIRLGQKVTFFPDGLPARGFDGTLTWISPEVNHQTRTIQLRADVANRDGALRANMFGRGELDVEPARQRLVVPQAAVQVFRGSHIVFVQAADNQFEVRRVVVGTKDDPFWEITSGVAAGERVATTGSFLLKSNLENPDFGTVE